MAFASGTERRLPSSGLRANNIHNNSMTPERKGQIKRCHEDKHEDHKSISSTP